MSMNHRFVNSFPFDTTTVKLDSYTGTLKQMFNVYPSEVWGTIPRAVPGREE